MSPADAVQKLIVQLGLGTEPADGLPWPCFSDSDVFYPDETVVVHSAVGRVHPRESPTRTRDSHPGVRVLVRSGSYSAAYDRAYAIAQAFDQVSYLAVTGGRFVYEVVRSSDPVGMGRESATSSRWLFYVDAVVALGG